jgi:hypothetical protein
LIKISTRLQICLLIQKLHNSLELIF